MFKVNNKNNKTMSFFPSFLLLNFVTTFSSVSIVDFGQLVGFLGDWNPIVRGFYFLTVTYLEACKTSMM